MPEAYTFQDFLEDEMNRRKVSQNQFAELIGIASSTITRLMNRRNPSLPSIDLIVKLSDLTGVDAGTLLGLAFPALAERMKLSADTRLMAQRIEQAPENVQSLIKTLIRGSN